MKILFISTFNKEGLVSYGARMASSFAQHMTSAVDLRIYSEGWQQPAIDADEVLPLEESCSWLADFKLRHRGKPTRNFRMDAVRFSHKVAAVLHAARDPKVDYLVWLDGDTVMHTNMDRRSILELLPSEDQWIAWLNRTTLYPECGFFILNCRHPRHGEALDQLEAMYRDDGLFKLEQWHDSFVLEHVVTSMGLLWKSLSGEARRTPHPFVNSDLGKWFDHMKGARKALGRSSKSDIRLPRTEPYWSKK